MPGRGSNSNFAVRAAGSARAAPECLDQQAALQVGFVPGREAGTQAQVSAKADVELPTFSIVCLENPRQENHFVENDGVTLYFEDLILHVWSPR